MIVFRTYVRILRRHKVIMLLILAMMMLFAVLYYVLYTDNGGPTNYVGSKPMIYIENNDQGGALSEGLVGYLDKNCDIQDIGSSEQALDDAMFYQEVEYAIFIPAGWTDDLLAGENPPIEVRSVNEVSGLLTEELINQYVRTARLYIGAAGSGADVDQIVSDTLDTMKKSAEVKVFRKSSTNLDRLHEAGQYFDFGNFVLLFANLLVIGSILLTFRKENLQRRTMVSSFNLVKFNRQLFLANGLFALVLWIVHLAIGSILLPDVMFTSTGLLFAGNSFMMTLCSLSLGMLVAYVSKSLEAVTGLMNIIALGASFLCGAFVPLSMLPSAVVKAAHCLPSYWYVANDEIIANIDVLDWKTVQQVLVNYAIIAAFVVLFFMITLAISHRQRQAREA